MLLCFASPTLFLLFFSESGTIHFLKGGDDVVGVPLLLLHLVHVSVRASSFVT